MSKWQSLVILACFAGESAPSRSARFCETQPSTSSSPDSHVSHGPLEHNFNPFAMHSMILGSASSKDPFCGQDRCYH
ncbi:hypothetical protein BD410DRAFT_452580 [Rickenella mellea]|uniref:Uncharacterized protein n=1 Tax=Rickenella mellea TaxID=50990 RepID=A0A4Y7PVA9_9AGAM|nr:hypothetical protein BD410DRAFT_452580 [Rickenella mellea]